MMTTLMITKLSYMRNREGFLRSLRFKPVLRGHHPAKFKSVASS